MFRLSKAISDYIGEFWLSEFKVKSTDCCNRWPNALSEIKYFFLLYSVISLI